MDSLACMTTFVAVVETGGFASAARYLSIAPATVSQRIQGLEHEIGARVLSCTNANWALTEVGRALYKSGKKTLEDIREADAIASEFHASSHGTLRVNVSPTLAKTMGNLVSRYARMHPGTTVVLSSTERACSPLDNGFDLAIRDDAVTDSKSLVRQLASVEWTVCASPGYVGRHGAPAHPDELSQFNCLVYGFDQSFDAWTFRDLAGRYPVRVSGSLRSNDPYALRSAALSDEGVVHLPDALVSDDLEAGHLVRVLASYSTEPVAVRAVYPCRKRLSLKVRSFLDFAAEEMSRPSTVDLHVTSATRAACEAVGRNGNWRSERASSPMAV